MSDQSDAQIHVAVVSDSDDKAAFIEFGKVLTHLVTLDRSAPKMDKIYTCGTIAHPDSNSLRYCTQLHTPIKFLRAIPIRVGRNQLIICESCISQIQDARIKKDASLDRASGSDAYRAGYLKGMGDAAGRAVDVLNEGLMADHKAMTAIFQTEVKANDALANHLTIQISRLGDGPEYIMRPLGLINGLFGGSGEGWGFIYMVVNSHGQIIKFVQHETEEVTTEATESEANGG